MKVWRYGKGGNSKIIDWWDWMGGGGGPELIMQLKMLCLFMIQ